MVGKVYIQCKESRDHRSCSNRTWPWLLPQLRSVSVRVSHHRPPIFSCTHYVRLRRRAWCRSSSSAIFMSQPKCHGIGVDSARTGHRNQSMTTVQRRRAHEQETRRAFSPAKIDAASRAPQKEPHIRHPTVYARWCWVTLRALVISSKPLHLAACLSLPLRQRNHSTSRQQPDCPLPEPALWQIL